MLSFNILTAYIRQTEFHLLGSHVKYCQYGYIYLGRDDNINAGLGYFLYIFKVLSILKSCLKLAQDVMMDNQGLFTNLQYVDSFNGLSLSLILFRDQG